MTSGLTKDAAKRLGVKTANPFDTLGLVKSNRFAVLRDLQDASTLISYESTRDAAVATQLANTTGEGVPIIVPNLDHADYNQNNKNDALGAEFFDPDDSGVWWA